MIPKMLSIREAARKGPLSEYTLRRLVKTNQLPCIYSGNKCLINYEMYIKYLNDLGKRPFA